MNGTEKEYIVTVRKDVDWRELHAELINDTTTNDSVDSNIVPDRACECCDERLVNPRVTHYHLTEEEAEKLKNDLRVVAVESAEHIPPSFPSKVQEGEFNRNSTDTGVHDNWGLLRHINETNVFAGSTNDPGGAYNYVLDGTGVDIVIMDTGIEPNHPEWEDANGVSRLKQIDWFTASGVSGTQPTDFYTDIHGHGTHCAGTVAGKTFGWAKNADIYAIQVNLGQGGSGYVSTATGYDLLLGWHNAKTNGRPTVVNMSFGSGIYMHTDVTPNQISFDRVTKYNIIDGRYRGTPHSQTTRTGLNQYGVVGSLRGENLYLLPYKSASTDATIESLINAGIHVCIAAGNDYMKIDLPGGSDYDNYFSILNTDNKIYYHRGSSPSNFEGSGTYNGSGTFDNPVSDINEGQLVGALDSTDTFDSSTYKDAKVNFSNSGPAVNIYSAGDEIMSSSSNTNSIGGVTYFDNASYKQCKISGTSMASPQMAGMTACLLQAHLDWSPLQVKNYFTSNAKAVMYSTGNDNDYTTTNSIHGGNNRVAYFPMNGSKPFGYSSS